MIKKNRNGFTLIELVITIVIVSILSLLAAYAYEVYVEEAKHSEVYGMINGIQNAQRVYYSEHGIWASDIKYLTIEIGKDSRRSYITGVNGSGRYVKDYVYSTWTDGNGLPYIGYAKSRTYTEDFGWFGYSISIWHYDVAFQMKENENSFSLRQFLSGRNATSAELRAAQKIIYRFTDENASSVSV